MQSLQLSPIFVQPFPFPLTPLRLPPRPVPHFYPNPFPLPLLPLRSIHRALRVPSAIGPDGKFHPSAPTPPNDEPPEAPEDSLSQQFERQLSRGRKAEEKDQALLLSALALAEDPPDIPDARHQESSGENLLGSIDLAIAHARKEFVDQGLLEPNPPKKKGKDLPVEEVDKLTPEEVVDLDEIYELQRLTVVSEDEADKVKEEGGPKGKQTLKNSDEDGEKLGKNEDGDGISGSKDSGFPSFDLDLDIFGRLGMQLLEPKYQMTLAELMDESRLVPLSVYGDLEVPITGIQHDSREVTAGDLFVCCVDTESHLYLSEAGKRGAVAVVATKEINIDETLGCKALVIVEDANAVLATLAASFYRHPSKSMSVIGIAGTNGKTTTAYLIKGLYEAMAVKTGMLTTVGYFLQGNYQVDIPESTDAVIVQKLMAKMVHNGTEAMVMEATAPGFAPGMSDEIDFDIAVFTNLNAEENGFHGSEKYISSQVKLFERMVDPERHRKVVNLDDPNAPLFVGLGNTGVPIITYALDNKNADVHALKYELSLFETLVLVNTPDGILEISSGLLGRNNIYNILAAVAVGVAVGAPLENIVRGIEEVDAVPGRCELIDEEQAFGVIVDHARTPAALTRLLDGVRELGPRRIITVFGCCGEKERGKRPLMTKIVADKSDVVLLTSDNPQKEEPMDILDDMLSGVGWSMQDYLKYGENDYYPPLPNGHRLFLHDIRRVAVRAAVAMGEEGDVVVVAGKGHETYQIEGDKKEFFDDREECRDALHYVDELHHAGIDTSEFPWRFPDSH